MKVFRYILTLLLLINVISYDVVAAGKAVSGSDEVMATTSGKNPREGEKVRPAIPKDGIKHRVFGQKLISAVTSGTYQEVKELIEKGADPDFKNKYELPPLMAAAKNGRVRIVTYLLHNGASPGREAFKTFPL